MPPTPKDLLLAELAVQTGFASREQVNSCLAGLDSGKPGRTLSQALGDAGIVDPMRMRLLLQLADKEPAVQQKDEAEDDGQDFSKLIEIKRFAAAGEVDKVMGILRSMKGDSKFGRLGKILLKKSMLNAEQIHAMLEEKGIKILRCPVCSKNYEVKDFDPAKKYGCPKCKKQLKPLDYSEIPIPDSDMEVVVEEG